MSKSSQEKQSQEFKNTNYELFILLLSILSILNIFLEIAIPDEQMSQVINVIDVLLSFIFLFDFLFRLRTAESKREYFFKQWGWLDLIGAFPLPRAKIARMARVIRAVRLMRRFGLRQMIREFVSDRAGSALYTVAFLAILILEFGSISVLRVEQYAENANITTANDAIWWAFVTMSTVGYGDQFPVTLVGRFFSIFVIVIGVGLFGVITGFLADYFTGDNESSLTPDVTSTLDVISERLTEIKNMQGDQGSAIEALQSRLDDLEQLLRARDLD
jgi:hypothetical protein